jgi:2-methylisocitrate lyase-like PEP mutase family enzyme
MARRFPPPWNVEEIPGGYKVLDASGQSVAYVYGRETKADADTAKVLTMDEARRIAANIARLPVSLGTDVDHGSAGKCRGTASTLPD